MAPHRVYIPSNSVLSVLRRPRPLPCPLVRRLPTQCRRGKRSKAIPEAPPKEVNVRKLAKAMGVKDMPIGEHIKASGRISLSFWEQDLDCQTPERLVQTIATPEDVDREKKMLKMLEDDRQNRTNPEYDDTDLKRALLDNMMRDPSFSDLRDGLEAMKKGLLSQEEKAKVEADMEKNPPPELTEWIAAFNMSNHEAIQELIDDEELAQARPELIELRRLLPDLQDISAPSKEWEIAQERLVAKLEQIPAWQRRVVAAEEERKSGHVDEDIIDKGFLNQLEGNDTNNLGDGGEDMDALLRQMQEVLRGMGGDTNLEGDIQKLLDEDPVYDVDEHEGERDIDFKDLAEQIAQLKNEDQLDQSTTKTDERDADGEKVDPKLEAIVDKIMEDPNLLKKLAMIKEAIDTRKSDIALRAQPSAPDPVTLDSAELITYRERLKIADNEPQHIAALRRLRINLIPPFNVSPAVKTLNEALRLAYLGASDDVRRILWRAYSKARTVPTLLQNVPDDAWDMLWYSQAVTWSSNQNRSNHLRILLQDLESVGKDGPPTHPDTIATEQQAHQ